MNMLPNVRQLVHAVETTETHVLVTPKGCSMPIEIPIENYSIWVFDGTNPISIYRDKLQYQCNLQVAGDKHEAPKKGRKALFVPGGDADEGTDFTFSLSFNSKVDSKNLFYALADAKGISVEQIEEWERTAVPYEKPTQGSNTSSDEEETH